MDSKNNPYIHLHSKYNPEAEALRYINSLDIKENTECFILIEPGDGYMIPILADKYPDSKIITLHVNDPESENILYRDLAQPIDVNNIKIIEWRPSMAYYGGAYVKLLSLVVKYLKRLEAEKRTVTAFGARWMRNFFRNLENIRSLFLYKETDIPAIITGSGPSLETAIPSIKEAQKNCLIISASSSAMALSYNGIKPDLIISTDGGNWALKHLYELYREKTNPPPALAANLCAALPSQCFSAPLLLLNDSSVWQTIVLGTLQLPSVLIPQCATVSASAVELALQLTGGNIYLAGVDLAVKDIRTHTRPYALDNYLLERENRRNPVYSQRFVRSTLMKEGGSLDIYADWFKSRFEKWPKRVCRLDKEKFSIELRELTRIKKEERFKAIPVKTNNGAEILLNNLTDDVKKELAPLIGKDIEEWIKSTLL